MGNVFRLYLPVVGGLAAGTWIGGFVLDADPALLGWIFGAGSGLMGGAFLAALVSNVPLARPQQRRRAPRDLPGRRTRLQPRQRIGRHRHRLSIRSPSA